MTRLGQVLRGKWQLDALLGIGSMAAVYAATHRNGKRVAVKMLHPEMSADADVRARFLREGYAANKVEHPGCVSVIDDDTSEDGQVYLVMEMLRGETLLSRAMKHGGRLPVAEVVALGDQLLDVLAAAHDKGIVHRDLKPDNLFLTTEGQLKVLDFGLARLREKKQVSATMKESMMGTPAFMPPEQALAKWDLVDGRSDLWAVGATLFNLLTGRLVHETDSVTALLVAISTRPVVPVATVNPMIPPGIAAVVDRALAFERNDRFQDARSMQLALRKAVQALPPGTLEAASLVSEAAPMSVRPFGFSGGGAVSPSSPPPIPGGAGGAGMGGTFLPTTSGSGGLAQRRAVPIAVAVALAVIAIIAIVIVRGSSSGDATTAAQAPSGTPVGGASAAPTESAEAPIDLGDLDEPGTAGSGSGGKKPRVKKAAPAATDAQPSTKKPSLSDTLNQFD
jgi:serine/threonine-protein kinase